MPFKRTETQYQQLLLKERLEQTEASCLITAGMQKTHNDTHSGGIHECVKYQLFFSYMNMHFSFLDLYMLLKVKYLAEHRLVKGFPSPDSDTHLCKQQER